MPTPRASSTKAVGISPRLSLSARVPRSLRRRAGVCVAAAAACLTGAAKRVVAAEQLLDPVLWYSDVAQSEATGLAYNSKSGVLYQVGNRLTDIDTGADLGQPDVFMRGFNVSSKNETFFYSGNSTYGQSDQWRDVAVDEENDRVFGVGRIYNSDIELAGSFHVRAFNGDGDTLWSFQEHAWIPRLGRWSDFQGTTFLAAEYDATSGLLLVTGVIQGCIGMGCTLPFDNDLSNVMCLAGALNATNGNLTWSREIMFNADDRGAGAGIAVDGEGAVFIGGDHANITQSASDFLIAALEVETGEVIWEWRHGTIHSDELTAIAYDDNSGILYACGFTAGNFSLPLDADPAPASKKKDAVVLALNTSTQELLWLKTFSSGPDVDRDDEADAITFDRSGMLHVSGNTRGKGFNAAGGELADSASIKDRNTLIVHFTMSLNATDGETLGSFQSLDLITSTFDASVMVPDTAQGDLYVTGKLGSSRDTIGITYVRSRPTLAPTPAPTTPAPTTAAPTTPAPTLTPTPAPTTPAPTTAAPTTPAPTLAPTPAPTTPAPTTPAPTTAAPTTPGPTAPALTFPPTPAPVPTPAPTTLSPTNAPSPVPTPRPTEAPTPVPTPAPIPSPTKAPTEAPTPAVTLPPVLPPTPSPTETPVITFPPTPAEVVTPSPTVRVTPAPTLPAPTLSPVPPPTSSPASPPTPSPVPPPTPSPVPPPTLPPVPPPTPSPVLPPPTAAPQTVAGVAGVDPTGDDDGGGSSGLTQKQQVLILFGFLAAGGVLAALAVLWAQLRGKGGGGPEDEDDDNEDFPNFVDGTRTDV